MTLLRPYQQEMIDRLKALGSYAVFDHFAGRPGLTLGADRITRERAERLIRDLKAANASNAEPAKTVAIDIEQGGVQGLNPQHLRNAMFGIRYGKTSLSTGRHEDSARMFLGGKIDRRAPALVYLRRTLMFYHVQNALMNWSQ